MIFLILNKYEDLVESQPEDIDTLSIYCILERIVFWIMLL